MFLMPTILLQGMSLYLTVIVSGILFAAIPILSKDRSYQCLLFITMFPTKTTENKHNCKSKKC